MVATLAAPLVQRGAQVGVLIGTAYLFTDEAVASGAIVENFRREAIRCERTVLLESGPGHATRCAPSDFATVFQWRRRDLQASGVSAEEIRERLERLNIGRLRVASKGLVRDAKPDRSSSMSKLAPVREDRQRAEGLYMLGQVAALRAERSNLQQLHHDVSVDGTRRLDEMARSASKNVAGSSARPADVAIIGMSCILPGAPDLETYWSNILGKVDAITEIPPHRWDWQTYYDPDRSAPDRIYSKWGGFLADHPFDPTWYGMPPSSIPSIDPLQLLTLEAVRAALADAGYLKRQFDRSRASVVLGVGGGSGDLGQRYALRAGLPQLFDHCPDGLLDQLPEWTEDSFAGILLNVAAGRVANRFDLRGVNYTVDAACASSLAAAYLATTELQLGTSDLVIVGGVDTVQSPFGYLCFSKTQALSPSGKCRPFDAAADGIAISEGLAFAVLKRLADAERDGDRIYAVIKGIAGSSDGRAKGLTAPRPEGQALALERAYLKAGFGPETVGLMEAHGTGTAAGDKAEIETLSKVFQSAGAAPASCAIGSVKSMIGHTKCAAGLAGMIKVAMALHCRVLPPTINVDQPSASLITPDNPIYVNTEARPWLAGNSKQRRAGVSSFGFGGTNFTALLEEYAGDFLDREDRPATHEWPCELFLWRAMSPSSLATDLTQLADALADGAEPALRDLAALQWRTVREQKGIALAIVADSLGDLRLKIEVARGHLQYGDSVPLVPGVHYAAQPLAAQGKIAFLFPGQGSQSVNMLRELALHFAEVRTALEHAQTVLADQLTEPLGCTVFPPPCFTDDDRNAQTLALTRTDIAQPALGAVEMGLSRLVQRLGVRPDMAGGHSYGELAALCCAGVFDEASLYRLSELRGRTILDSITDDPGTMAAVRADRVTTEELLDGIPGVSLANINAPGQMVISGARDGVAAALDRMRAQRISVKPLTVSCAFHSPVLRDAGNRLSTVLMRQKLVPPRFPVYSNARADVMPADPNGLVAALSDQVVSPVRFQEEVEAMYRDGARIFVEVGPKNVLTGLVGSILAGLPHLAVALDVPGRGGLGQLQQSLALLAAHGVPINLDRLFSGRSCLRLSFERLREETRKKLLPSTTWMVNGGSARSVTERPNAAATAVSAAAEGNAAKYDRGGVLTMPLDLDPRHGSAGLSNTPMTHAPIDQQYAPSERSPTPLPDDATQVVARFQQVMERFLQTQQRVMEAYLTGTSSAETFEIAASAEAPRIEAPAAAMEALAHTPAEATPAIDPAPAATPRFPLAAKPSGPAAPTFASAAQKHASSPPAPHDVTQTLLRIVSDRTGYPPEMLGLDLNIEADLGIDSIKRVEIMAEIRRAVLGDGTAEDGEIMERTTEIKTLRGMIEAISGALETQHHPFVRHPAGAVLQT